LGGAVDSVLKDAIAHVSAGALQGKGEIPALHLAQHRWTERSSVPYVLEDEHLLLDFLARSGTASSSEPMIDFSVERFD
jgi:hypothetical protein